MSENTSSSKPQKRRTTVSVEFKNEDFDRLQDIKARAHNASYPSILRSFTFAYDELQQKTAASLASGQGVGGSEAEHRISQELRGIQRELAQTRRELNATAALLESLVKLFLTHIPAPPEAARSALAQGARVRFDKVIANAGTRFDGETAAVLEELERRAIATQTGEEPV